MSQSRLVQESQLDEQRLREQQLVTLFQSNILYFSRDFSPAVFVFVVAMWVEVVKRCLQAREEAPQMWKLMAVKGVSWSAMVTYTALEG